LLVLDFLFNRRPDDPIGLYFKGGTSLSKAYGLIHRFSEDIYKADLRALGLLDAAGRALHEPACSSLPPLTRRFHVTR